MVSQLQRPHTCVRTADMWLYRPNNQAVLIFLAFLAGRRDFEVYQERPYFFLVYLSPKGITVIKSICGEDAANTCFSAAVGSVEGHNQL